jgi:hypothetical protein
MLEGLFGLKISEGTIANMLARAATVCRVRWGNPGDGAQQPGDRQRRDLGPR